MKINARDRGLTSPAGAAGGFTSIPLEEVATLADGAYRPRGATPLNDAVVATIRAIDARAARDDRVMLVVLTDGLENASETPSRTVRDLIAEREAAGWEFIYLGANQDSWADSEQIDVAARGRKFDFLATPEGTAAALHHSALRVRDFRDDPDLYEQSRQLQGDAILEDGQVERRRPD